ncbi:MAG TPA: amylo-alpha-1,6-glucosidase [Victivallales bacterium]|nr:amylo-alpha-1,6-glucosidase [Victivallales bacterium]
MIQKPFPGEHILLYRGDTIDFSLSFDKEVRGKAFLRTNLENASIAREEIISSVLSARPRSGQDWHDIPLEKKDNFSFSIRIALLEEGHFEAKCFYIEDEEREPHWVDGPNVHINVEPSGYCCANSIYCAFVRQFGINKNFAFSRPIPKLEADEIAELDRMHYTVIPPSGTFRDLKKCLPHIIDDLNCRIIHLLPINPTPTVFARMGRYGSPYASLDFTSIDPSLAEFDRKATPLDQFLELVDAIHRKNAKIFIDLAINHTGWASKIHETHPEWLIREEDGSIHSPGAWGVVWGDLTELNHNKPDLWDYLAEVFLTWCARGVDGFRCDAGYMIPEKAWEYIIAKVRVEYPETIFLLEGLGGAPEITRRLLDNANMNWAYSELFQNYTREQIEGYIPYAHKVSLGDGIMVHYAETHDNNRLAATSEIYAKMRTALSALASNNGAFGFTNGVEWFAKEKIDVHESNALNWGAKVNQIAHISRLNSILISHPAFYNGSKIKIIDSGHQEVVAFTRSDSNSKSPLLILINLNCEKESVASWLKNETPHQKDSLIDLISEETFVFDSGNLRFNLKLSPGQALCLSPSINDMKKIIEMEDRDIIKPDRITLQNAMAMAMDIITWQQKSHVIIDKNPHELANTLLDNPYNFCREIFKEQFCKIVEWHWPEDIKRLVMLPPDHLILVRAQFNFRVRIADENGKILIQRDSLRAKGAFNFVLIPPLKLNNTSFQKCKIRISVYADDKSYRESSELLVLPRINSNNLNVVTMYDHTKIANTNLNILLTNGRGGFAYIPVKWAELSSRYDCLLAGNLNPNHPEDRHIMWTRCRICTDYHGRKEWFSKDKIDNFSVSSNGNCAIWEFSIPLGNGIFAKFAISIQMLPMKNQTIMTIKRLSAKHLSQENQNINIIDDKVPLKLIIKPDIEDRNFHHETKAYLGPENLWQNQVLTSIKSFVFEPAKDRKLCMYSTKGKFKTSPEWSYSIFRKNEAERGLDPNSDLFSPGYFELMLGGDEYDVISGCIITDFEPEKVNISFEDFQLESEINKKADFSKTLISAMEKFIVKRDNWKTIIAGYPWFIDWGRDTLIASRGLIAANKKDDVEKIILLFAKFAENGTIPNMIMGTNASNRDTSDAPLWLFLTIKDYCETFGDAILSEKINDEENLLSVLKTIAKYYVNGTPNGIKMDPESGLIFSPSHFTWMDTNYPAGTPREGYPIEIQALWISALEFLYQKTNISTFEEIRQRAINSLKKFYIIKDPITEEYEWLSDCLHCSKGKSAARAVKDDHLRPNQLLTITLGVINGEEKLQKGILKACSELIIPGAIRSLADRPVKYELPIIGSNGNILNNPSRPYFGHYIGPEDTSRKPAYHNGTAWTWLFPSYPEALVQVYGKQAIPTALSILSSSLKLLEDGSIGNIPEILDGDYPHLQRGCLAQAWGVTELFRVWQKLTNK